MRSSWVESVRSTLPELPHAKRARFQSEYQLSEYAVGVLTEDNEVAAFYEAAVNHADTASADKLANWLTGDTFALLNEAGASLTESNISASYLAELVDLVESGSINATTGKDVLAEVFKTGKSPTTIVSEQGLQQQDDPELLADLLDQVLRENPDQVEQYMAGKEAVSQWFFGQVMRATKGQADPQVVRQVLDEKLSQLGSDANSS